jgi:hypothetical protein
MPGHGNPLSTLYNDVIWNHICNSSLPLTREVILNHTNLVSKVHKLHSRHRLAQRVCYLLICSDILKLHFSLLHHISDIMVLDLDMLGLVMKHQVLQQLHQIQVASNSRSNNPTNIFQSHTSSLLAEHAAIYSASAVLSTTLVFFLLNHEIIADPKLKQHLDVLFRSATLPAQYELV